MSYCCGTTPAEPLLFTCVRARGVGGHVTHDVTVTHAHLPPPLPPEYYTPVFNTAPHTHTYLSLAYRFIATNSNLLLPPRKALPLFFVM